MATAMHKHAYCLIGRFTTRYRLWPFLITSSTYNERTYARALRRQPIKVLTSQEAINLAKGVSDSDIRRQQNQNKARPQPEPEADACSKTKSKPLSQPGTTTSNRRIANDNVSHSARANKQERLTSEISYIKLHKGDERFGKLVMAAKSRKLRERKDVILLEGRRLITDALMAGVQVQAIYFTKLDDVYSLPWRHISCPFYKVENREMQLWSDVTTSSGLMAVCKKPIVVPSASETLPITLICDNIREPGNMGTILRSAGAAGCRLVIATSGCVDVWEPKVLRAGAGVHFHTNIVSHIGWPLVTNYLSPDCAVYLADSASSNADSSRQVSPDVIERIASLAPAVHTEVDEVSGESRQVDASYADAEHVKLFNQIQLPVLDYSTAQYCSGNETVLVIGGETHGLSAEARKLAFERNGDCVFIPMNAGVNSLNSSTAASVILFEIQRQLRLSL